MTEAIPILQQPKSEKQELLDRKEKLQKKLRELDSVAESQVGYIKDEIERIDEKVRKLETNQFNKGSDKLKSKMEQQNAQNLTPEQMMQMMAQKQAS